MFELSLNVSLPGPMFGKHDWNNVILPPIEDCKKYKTHVALL
jgi:hypothetical protein